MSSIIPLVLFQSSYALLSDEACGNQQWCKDVLPQHHYTICERIKMYCNVTSLMGPLDCSNELHH